MRGCSEGVACDPVSWTCDDEDGVSWKCVRDLYDLEVCSSPAQCRSGQCSTIKIEGGAKSEDQICGSGVPPCGTTDLFQVCGQFPFAGECEAPQWAQKCELGVGCRSDAGCESGICKGVDSANRVLGTCAGAWN